MGLYKNNTFNLFLVCFFINCTLFTPEPVDIESLYNKLTEIKILKGEWILFHSVSKYWGPGGSNLIDTNYNVAKEFEKILFIDDTLAITYKKNDSIKKIIFNYIFDSSNSSICIDSLVLPYLTPYHWVQYFFGEKDTLTGSIRYRPSEITYLCDTIKIYRKLTEKWCDESSKYVLKR